MAESSEGTTPHDNPLAAFGANEWLVDEMYERYQQDPNSVDKAWWAFFKDYQPEVTPTGNGTAEKPAQAAAPSGPAKPPAGAAPPKQATTEKAEKAAP
ncbi:MAG: 2-oxoglutarate dehydrogenase E1 subunit family protein, partial [Nocardioidaceae bacterium]